MSEIYKIMSEIDNSGFFRCISGKTDFMATFKNKNDPQALVRYLNSYDVLSKIFKNPRQWLFKFVECDKKFTYILTVQMYVTVFGFKIHSSTYALSYFVDEGLIDFTTPSLTADSLIPLLSDVPDEHKLQRSTPL